MLESEGTYAPLRRICLSWISQPVGCHPSLDNAGCPKEVEAHDAPMTLQAGRHFLAHELNADDTGMFDLAPWILRDASTDGTSIFLPANRLTDLPSCATISDLILPHRFLVRDTF
jgi:hypothetical protein